MFLVNEEGSGRGGRDSLLPVDLHTVHVELCQLSSGGRWCSVHYLGYSYARTKPSLLSVSQCNIFQLQASCM